MKTKSNIKYWLFLVIVIIMGACSSDDETIIVPKTLEQYKTELESFIMSQISFVDNCVVGFNKGDFRSSTNFVPYTTNYKSRLVAALAVLDKPDLKVEDITIARTSLATHGKLYQAEIFISDRRALNDLIIGCDALIAATPDGNAPGQVAPAVRVPFTQAITAAKATRTSGSAIQRMIDDEVVKLTAAKTAFEAAIIK
jgi:hypothetical protein